MFVGTQREQAVTALVERFDRVRATKRPEMVVLESETGLGKTRIIQEFYARLARDRQGVPPYWPERVDTQTTGDVLRDRKRITPATPFTIGITGCGAMTEIFCRLEINNSRQSQICARG